MGWSFECSPSRLKDYLAYLTRDEEYEISDGYGNPTGDRHIRKCLTKKYVMSNPGAGRLWSVWEYWVVNKWGREITKRTRYIGYDLIKWGGGGSHGWGHKSMTSESGVGDTSCPVKYLEMVPPPVCSNKNGACDIDPYSIPGARERKEHEAGCRKCHGCGACWDAKWRKNVLEKNAEEQKLRRFANILKPGDRVVIREGYTTAGQSLVVTEVRRQRGRLIDLLCGYTRVKLKNIDIEASLALNTDVELEDK